MSALDLEALLGPVSEDEPCGEDLEYDAEFGELDRAAQPPHEQAIGDEEIQAEEPKWPDVAKRATALLGRTKDLRVAVHLTNALVHTEGMPGLHDGVRLIHGLLDQYWDSVYPKLDEEDNDDPTMRMNTLMALNDADGILKSVRRAPLVSSVTLGRFSHRDMQLAAGETSPTGDDEVPDAAHVDAAFLDCDLDELQTTANAVSGALETVQATDALLTDKVGGAAPDLNGLVTGLKAINNIMAEQLLRRGVGEGPVAEDDAGAIPGAARAISGEINSREDVVRLLDRMCDYFKKHEPSSPLPLLLQRAKRLVSKDFLEILRDLTPDGVHQAETIGGVEPEE